MLKTPLPLSQADIWQTSCGHALFLISSAQSYVELSVHFLSGPEAMAKAKRHHFLPQFLLRGFATLKKGQYHTYRFPRVGKPHVVNVINVGVAGKFHDGPYGDIEARLSAREDVYRRGLDELRQGHQSSGNINVIAELVFNMMVRTKNLRDGMTDFAGSALVTFQTPRIERAMRKHVFKRLMERPEIKPYLERFPKKRRERVFAMLATKSGIDFGSEYNRLFEGLLQNIDISKMTKDSHLKVLAQTELPEARKESLLNYRWYIDKRSIGAYVLGDLGPLARVPESPQLTFPFGFGIPTAIYLPISSAELLIGTSQVEDAGQINPDEVNLASVELSRDFFVSIQNTQREMDYQQHIGTRAEFVKEADLSRMAKEVVERMTDGRC